MPYCSYCNKDVVEGLKFCPHCGKEKPVEILIKKSWAVSEEAKEIFSFIGAVISKEKFSFIGSVIGAVFGAYCGWRQGLLTALMYGIVGGITGWGIILWVLGAWLSIIFIILIIMIISLIKSCL